MALHPGTKLGSYEVLSSLGAGGMGEVYRARDTKLNRDVALKVLPDVLANDPERMARFKREAQVLASLNHPNIATIYGFEESQGVRALTMELVEGHTLAERIAGTHPRTPGSSWPGKPKSAGLGEIVLGSPLPVDEGLAISKQIAEALEYAHDRGIVHRDLKPANIKIAPDGTAKVLDFGLAKALEADPSQSSSVSTSPTLTAMATQAGVIIGTAAYMSPEQARGKSVDRRADIWSFGCVLYEMFSGRRLFEGETVTDVLAAVVRAEPDWAALPAELPRRMGALIRRCLTKDPRQRLRDVGEARITIEKVIAGGDEEASSAVTPPTPATPAPPRQSTLQRALPWGVAAAALLAASVLGIVYFGSSSAPARAIRSTILPPEDVSFASSGTFGGGAVVSPDGTRLVAPARDASGKYSLWVRQLDSLTMQKLEGTEGGRYPFWSPDSRFVGFFVEGKLKKIDVSGGPPQSVCDVPSGRGGAWSKNDLIVFSPDLYAGLSSVPAAGGASTPLVQLDKSRQQTSLRWPAFLPDGRHFLYWGGDPQSSGTSGSNGIYVASIDAKDSGFLFKSDSHAVYAPPGYLLFLTEQNLMAQPFDAVGLKLTGNAFPVAEQIANPESFRLGFFSASQNGILVYQTGGNTKSQVLRLDQTGRQLDQIGTSTNGTYLELSPDGSRLAETLFDEQSKSGDIWLIDLARGVQTRFTFNPHDEDSPAFSPDGSRIVFASDRNGHYDLYVKDASGAGTEQPLFTSDDDKYPNDWSRDGKYIVFTQLNSKGKRSADIWILPLTGDKKPFPFLQTEFNEGLAMFSPDGHWLAYQSNDSGKPEIYIAPFNGNEGAAAGGSSVQGGKWQVSQGGGQISTWSRDGKSLYFLAPDNQVMQAEINFKGSAVEVGVPRAIFQATFASVGQGARTFDVAPDGKRFYILGTKETASVPITLVSNWTAGLKR